VAVEPIAKHFATIDENRVVTGYILAHSADDAAAISGSEVVEHPADNPPAVGSMHYVRSNKFVDPQPFPSWTLNASTHEWVAPIPMPTDPLPVDSDGVATNAYWWYEGSEEKPQGWYLAPLPVASADAPPAPGSNYSWIPERKVWVSKDRSDYVAVDRSLTPEVSTYTPQAGPSPEAIYPQPAPATVIPN
jgi:hypothetical protein